MFLIIRQIHRYNIGDPAATIPSGISSVFDDQVDDEKLLTMYETENLSLLEPIYKRFDEQFKLLQEQRFAQRVEAERAESHRVKMEHLFDEFSARVKHTELYQAELVTDIYMQLREKYEGEFKTNQQQLAKQQSEFSTIQQQLANQRSELNKLKQSHRNASHVTQFQSTPQMFAKKDGENYTSTKSTRKLPAVPTSTLRQNSYAMPIHLFSNSDAILKFQFGAMHAGLSRVKM